MSDDSAAEIKFDDYFKAGEAQEDDFDDSEEQFSVHGSQSLPKAGAKPIFAAKASSSIAKKQGGPKFTANKKKQATPSESENYDDFEEESKELHIGKAGANVGNQDEFEDDDDDAGFDNAFKYDKDEFKSDVSESQDQSNPPPPQRKQQSTLSFGDKEVKKQKTAKEIKIGGVAKQKTFKQEEFEDESEDDGAFDNAFKYNQDEFKSEISENSNKFSVHLEQSNPFKEKALMQTQKDTQKTQPMKQQPIKATQAAIAQPKQLVALPQQKSKIKEIEILLKEKSQSDVGFDDDIIDDHFSEEPIDDEVESNMSTKLKNMKDSISGATVNMGSVVPNPKLIQNTLGQTNQQRQETLAMQKQKLPPIEKNVSIQEEESKHDDSMAEINNQIEQIPSRFSPKSVQKKEQPRNSSKVRPQTAKPLVKKNASQSRKPNKDINRVINQEEEKTQRPQRSILKPRVEMDKAILRPESAKPKVVYEGKPNVIEKIQPPSANQNDLTAHLAKSKKFQMIKKLKEEKEKKREVTVRTLRKTNAISSAKPKPKQQNQDLKVVDQFENDSFFQEEGVGGGDQALRQSNNGEAEDDMFKEEGIGGGDQAFRPDEENQMDDFGNEGEDDFVDLDNFERQSVKDLAQKKVAQEQISVAKPVATKPPQTAAQPAQSILGNLIKPSTQANASRINPLSAIISKSMTKQVQDKKEDTKTKVIPVKDERFEEILRQKKEKAVNKDVLGFMMEKNQRNQKEKQEGLEQNINKLAQNFDLKEKVQEAKASDKVPEHAKLVIDDEKLAKELGDLKRRLKEINLENVKISSNVQLGETKKREKEALFDKLMQEKGLMNINGSLQMQREKAFSAIRLEDIPNFDDLQQEKVNPLDPVVKKIEKRGFTLDQAFNIFDDDGDEVLTLQEIKNGIKIQGIQLLDNEMQELVNQLDQNADGIITMDEWVNILNPKLDTEKEFRSIMQNIDIDDPLVLEERILDLRFRAQRLEKELEVLRETSGKEQGFNHKDRIKQSQKRFADKIKTLEQRITDKVSVMLQQRVELEEKINRGLMAKDEVHQDFYETQRQKDRIESEFSMRTQSVQDSLNVLDNKFNDVSHHCLMLKTEREQAKTALERMQIKVTSMAEMEAKLDKQLEEILGKAVTGKDLEMLYELDLKTLRQLNSGSNQKFDSFVKHFASITIQRVFRGYLGRKECKIVQFQMQRLARLLTPHVKEKLQNKKVKAATLIQRMFRRMRSRRAQLDNLRKRNEMRKLMEEEEDRFFKSQKQLDEAARTIARYWRSYKSRKNFSISQVSKLDGMKSFNRAVEVVYIASVRKCFICKQKTAQRQCQGCQIAMYCEECFVEYHARGHRKLHIYKRIRFGDKPIDDKEVEEEMRMRLSKKENLQPNIVPQESVSNKQSKAENQMPASSKSQVLEKQPPEKLKEEVKSQALNQVQESDTSLKITKTVKTVKLSDEGFLRSIKQLGVDFESELAFFLDIDDLNLIRLSDFETTLKENPQIFKVNTDDLERFCQIAFDRCQGQNSIEDDSMATWIDIRKLQLFLFIVIAAFVTGQDLNLMGHLSKAADKHASKFQQSLNMFEEFTQKWIQIYQLIYPSEETQRQQFEIHQKQGVFYSGEGSSQTIKDKKQENEEREKLERMAKNREFTDNPVVNKKLVELQQKELQEKVMKNDKNDLIYYQVLLRKDQTQPSSQDESPYLSLQAVYGDPNTRQLQQSGTQQTYVVRSLVEPYPQNGVCNNGGQISNITQIYYLCMLTNDINQVVFRVDQPTFTVLNQNFSDQVFCSQSNYVSNVCICPQGFYGYACDSQLNTQCFVNITDPPFYKSCQKEDSPYYLYSVPGYDPCYFLDFTQAIDIKFQLMCKYIDNSGLINANSENQGYAYRDVAVPPVIPSFSYQVTNPITGFSLVTNKFNPSVVVMLQDWKWLSQQTLFKANITDIQVAAGIKESSLNVNFSKLEASDSTGNSSYVVGGRAYFEAYAIGSGLSTYVSKGFFDKADYQEPFRQVTSSMTIVLAIAIPLGIAGLIGLGVYFFFYQKKKKDQTHNE